jgi:molybdenum cofactor synthesis domain-containing protein
VLTFDEALAVVLRESSPLPPEETDLAIALGRVLAEDVRADRPLPPFDRAAMDGFALRAQDAAAPGAVLPVAFEVRAGQWPERTLGAGEAARIMTGAPVPDGADAVQPVEKTRETDDGCVEIGTAVAPGAHVARRGSEAEAGAVVLERGRRIDPAALAVLASCGCVRPRVGRRPRVAVLVTGDEIVPADTPAAGPAQIRNSNGPAIEALARAAGAEVVPLGTVGAQRAALDRAIGEGLRAADVLVLSGGVSAGAYDLVEPALADAGATFLFTGVAIKPGAPLVFARAGGVLVFGLPGNPVSAQVTFELFARPCLLRLQGSRALHAPRVPVVLAAPLANRSGRVSHVPAIVAVEGGRLVARPVRSQVSGDLAAHARANALVVLASSRPRAEAGETAEAVLLGRFLEDESAATSL